MSQVQSPAPRATGEAHVRAAIARAASATGVDFDFLLAQAKIESGLKPNAEAPTSSAAGLYQFTNSTWLRTFARHGEKHGIGWAGAALSDPAMRTQAMALRYDPQVAALMAGELANDNRAALTASLGHEPDASELYLAHFLGSAGAGRFLNALASDPAQSAAALLPAAAGANRSIFYTPAGAPRSVSEVMGLIRAKVDGAMEGGEGPGPGLPAPFASPDAAFPTALAAAAPPSVPMGPIAREFHAAAPPTQERPSMAETLRQAFALGTQAGSAAPGHVRTAYARLSAMGL
ncbi:transglycosylase SLT domain-containing protein [Novosphingobium sp. TH158]|uniref:transglycosylase SLT domain-containing protein n=1 Tax=Novosphingobium sp. TH158 TaxID=2067455 RepID=UPI000C7AD0C9|nr:transglycosylase SLT domain-containing protein [Novosphingobium sp. TH158]PLK27658.1 transglycosylase [Novosphingobium sp. TH158]